MELSYKRPSCELPAALKLKMLPNMIYCGTVAECSSLAIAQVPWLVSKLEIVLNGWSILIGCAQGAKLVYPAKDSAMEPGSACRRDLQFPHVSRSISHLHCPNS